MKKNAPKAAKAASEVVLDKIANEIDALFRKYDVVGLATVTTKDSAARVLRLSSSWTSFEISAEVETPRKKATAEQDLNTIGAVSTLSDAIAVSEGHMKARSLPVGIRVMKAKGAPKELVTAMDAAAKFFARKVQVTPRGKK